MCISHFRLRVIYSVMTSWSSQLFLLANKLVDLPLVTNQRGFRGRRKKPFQPDFQICVKFLRILESIFLCDNKIIALTTPQLKPKTLSNNFPSLISHRALQHGTLTSPLCNVSMGHSTQISAIHFKYKIQLSSTCHVHQ